MGQLIQRETAALDDLKGSGERFGIAAEQAVHFLRRLEIAIGVPLPPLAQFVDGNVVTDAGDDVLQDASIGCVEQDIRSEEHTSELQSLMRISYAVFCLKKKTQHHV